MLNLLRRRDFALLFFGGLISILGDRVLLTALPFYVYQRSGSTMASALMVSARLVPHFLFGSLAGVFVDRWDRKRIMVISSLGQALVLLPIILVAGGAELWVVYLVSFFQTSLAIFFGPAETALLPRLVDEEDLLPANALNALNNNVARLIGPPVGGLVLAWGGLGSVVLFDSLTFVVAAGMIALIRTAGNAPVISSVRVVPERAGVMPTTQPSAWARFWVEWREGFQFIRTDRVVIWLFITVVLMNFAGTMIDPLWPAYMVNVVGADSQVYGLVMTAQALGGILGGLAAGKIGKRAAPALVYGLGEITLAVVLFVRYNIPLLPVVFITAFLTGPPAAIGAAGLETLFQKSVPNAYLGRVSGALNTTMSVVALFGVLGIAGALGDVLGTVPVLNIAAALTLIMGLLVLKFLAAKRVPEKES